MADGYISQIKTPDNKVYLLKDSEKTDEKVKQTSNTEDKEFPILFKNANNATEETAGVKYSGNITTDATTTKPFTFNPSTGNLTVTQLKIGTKNDNMGIFPNLNNWNQIGSSALYWYRSYINNYYGGRSHVDNWDSGKNIGIAASSSAAAVLGTVNFYNTAAAGATQTKTLLTADSTTNSNITVTLPKTTGTLALKSELPTLSGLSGIGTISASGTAPLTLSGSKSGTTYTLTGSIADASASASGIVNTDAQTFSGVKTFDNGLHIYGTISTQGTGSAAGTMYPGGAYHSGHNSIILHGDTAGVSGIGFTSEKATKSGTTTNINGSSDRAFIQYHAYGVTPAAEGTAPTLATSGELGTLVIGVGNDATDTIRLQAPGTAGILHQIGATAYPIPHTTNTNGSVGGTTTPVYVDAGVIKAGTALGTASQKAESYFVKAITSTDNAIARFNGTSGQVQNSGVIINDSNNIITTGEYIETAGGRLQYVQLLPGIAWSNYAADTWYRCCKITSKHYYINGIIQLSGNWSTGAPTMATVSIQMRSTYANITLLQCAHVGIIKSMRLVYSDSSWWLDVQVNIQSSGNCGVQSATFIGNIVASDINTALTATTDTTAPAATLHFKTKYNDDTIFKINNSINILDTTASTTTSTGALLVSGGAGIDGRVTAQEFNATRQMVLSAGKVYSNISGSNVLLPAKTTAMYANGIAIANPGLTAANDVGWIRALGTAETDMVLEIATGDDGGSGEQIVARQYNTSNAIAHEAVLLDKTGATSFPVSVTAPLFSGSGASLTSLNASNLSSGTVPVARLPLATTGAAGAVKIGSGISVSDGTISVTAANLGLSNAMHFIGIATKAITDGGTEDPTISGYSTKTAGDVVIDKDTRREYVWSTAGKWEMLGFDASAKYEKTTSGNTFISKITQATDGTITADSRELDTSGTWSGNATTATTATNLANNPSIQTASNSNQVTITAGGKTSSAYTIPYATSAGSATSATTATYIKCTDTRNATLNPTDLTAAQGIRFDFKAKGTINLTATDAYAGVMSFRPYASNTDWSGGNAHQLAFNSEGLHWRNGGASWGNWYQILDSNNTATGTNNTATLTWNTTYTIAKINGTDIKFTTMTKPTYAFSDLTSHPTTLSDYGITNAVQYNGIDNDIGSSATAANAKSYWANNNKVPKGKVVFNYNSSGTEFTTLFSNNNNSYGSILRWGYQDTYIRILRAHPNQTTYSGWYTEDWEKISAGYADSAGTATSAGKWTTARTLTIGSTGKSVDGSGNVSWSLADIGAATSGHSHTLKIGNESLSVSTSTQTWKLKDIQAGPQYHVGSTDTCTYVLVTINSETSWMLAFTLRLYQGYRATDIQISGYNYGSNHWYSPKAIILGDTDTGEKKVYFGYTGNYKLWVAVDGSSYTGADVFGVTNGYTQVDWENMMTITKVSSLPGTTQTTATIYRPWYRNETVSTAASANSVAWDNVSNHPTNLNQFTNGPGYVTSSGVTSIKLIQGAGITVSSSGTAITTTGERTISITGMDTTNGSTTKWLDQKGDWSTPTAAQVGAAPSSTVSCTTANIESALGIDFITHASALNANGWKTLGGRANGAKIAIAYNNNPASWNSASYSASLVFGCSDTKGLLDIGYNSPTVVFGGGNVNGSTDNDPKWYFKLSGTSGQTYTFPGTSKTLAASDGSNASGSWGINITGSAGSVAWANTNHPDTFPPTIGTTSTTAMAGNTTVTNVSYTATAATDDNEYPVLMKNSTGSDTTAAGVRFASGTNQQVTINPSTGTVSTRRLVINNSSSNGTVPDLVFSRTSWSYINIPDNDAAVLAIGRGTGDNASQKLIIQGDGTVRPGSDSTQSLGTSARRWQKIYGVNFYGTFHGTAASANQLNRISIANGSSLNNFIPDTDNGYLRYTWVNGANAGNDDDSNNPGILNKPKGTNAFGLFTFKTADNWAGQIFVSTNNLPGIYWRNGLTTSGSLVANWTPLANGNGGVYYGTCATAADVAEKVVVCKHYHTLKAGDIIVVTFDNANTQAQPQLNVNNTGAVGVKMAYSGGIVDLGSTTQLSYTCTFIYNGANWLIINQQNAIQIATASNQTNWRSILLSNSNDGNENFTPSANTLGRTYAAHNVKYQPSTGTLRAPIMKTPKVQIEFNHVNKAHIEWNDTDSSIDFIFD